MSQRNLPMASGGNPIRGEIDSLDRDLAKSGLESGRKPLGSFFRKS